MYSFKTICPYCGCENNFKIPSYQESIQKIKEDMKKYPEDKEMLLDTLECYEEEKITDYSALDEISKDCVPTVCKKCEHTYLFEDQGNVEDFEPFWMTALKKLNELKDIKDTRISYIYFLLNPQNNLTKIGYTNNIKKRQQDLKVALCNTKLICQIQTTNDCARAIEAIFHNIFKEYHVEGEWYNISASKIKKTVFGPLPLFVKENVNGIIFPNSEEVA